jgi:peptidyl-dipeptidase A
MMFISGNMWGQQWNNIYNLVEPYKGVEKIDVTPEMLRQVRSPLNLFYVTLYFSKLVVKLLIRK